MGRARSWSRSTTVSHTTPSIPRSASPPITTSCTSRCPGRRGIELVEELLPDLVLLDVMLPDTDGYDVCLRIKSNSTTAPIPVIFLSARGEVVDKVRGLSCGAADYITKPFQAAELLARIDAVLGQARNPRVPRLARSAERAAGERRVARVAIVDGALRAHVEQLLLSRFDLADAD